MRRALMTIAIVVCLALVVAPVAAQDASVEPEATLPQLLERNWRAGAARALAGLSPGGWGAVMAAAQHPKPFEAVASFSGAVDFSVLPGGSPEVQATVDTANDFAASQGWGEANPIDLAAGLAGLTVYISYGNG